MILHLIVDDKFIDAGRNLFEAAAPGENRYVLSRPGEDRGAKSIRRFKPEFATPRDVIDLVRSQPSNIDGVIVHWMSEQARDVISAIPRSVPVVWLGWGGDYWHLIERAENLLGPLTQGGVNALASNRRRMMRGRLGSAGRLARIGTKGIRKLAATLVPRQAKPGMRCGDESILSRVNFFVPVIEEDGQLILERNPWFRPKVLTWNYGALDDVFDATDAKGGPLGNDIFFGNSATPENNHLDLLPVLGEVLQVGARIICPLSYGDERYGDMVEAEGRRLYGERFVALRKFLPSTEYWSLMQSCSVFVMAHRRQQAGGNIIMGLYGGARVFLDTRNTYFGFFRRMGVPVFRLEDIQDATKAGPVCDRRSISEVRTRLRARFGYSACLERTRTMIREIKSGEQRPAQAPHGPEAPFSS